MKVGCVTYQNQYLQEELSLTEMPSSNCRRELVILQYFLTDDSLSSRKKVVYHNGNCRHLMVISFPVLCCAARLADDI